MNAFEFPAWARLRPATLDDAPAATALMNAELRALGVPQVYDVAGTLMDWTAPTFDIDTQSLLMETAEGRLAALAEFYRSTPPVRSYLSVTLHPDFFDAGLYAPLLAWGEAQAAALIPECDPAVQVSLVCGADEPDSHMRAALLAAGFTEQRRFYQMQVTMDAPPQVYPLPPGYHYESYRHPDDLEELVRVDWDAFHDHYGFVETDFNEEVEEIRHFFDTLAVFDPSIVYKVIEDATGRMVAGIWNLTEMEGDSSVAYVDSVGVLKEHRGRGIAIAMLTHSLAMHYAAGRRSVALHTDAENLTGALRLYEKAGMRPVHTSLRYEKVLREGTDPVRRNLTNLEETA